MILLIFLIKKKKFFLNFNLNEETIINNIRIICIDIYVKYERKNGESERYCILVSVIYNDYSKNNKKT